ncbi:MAG TPA: hypothetical protein VIJ75_08335 [Hanamia sp.]
MKKIFTFLVAFFFTLITYSQNIDKIINAAELERIERILSSDKMQGRKTFTPFMDTAANFIAGEFKKAGLKYFDGLTSYRQPFSMLKANLISASGEMNGSSIDAGHIIAITTDAE